MGSAPFIGRHEDGCFACDVVTSLAVSLLVKVSKGWGGSVRKIYPQGLGVAPAARE